MIKVIILLLLFLINDPNIMKSQVNQEWVATYSGTGAGFNFPKKMAVDNDGNIIVAGNSDSSVDYDYIVLKYDPAGNLIWRQRYNGPGNNYDYLVSMVLDDSNNIYVTGESDDGVLAGGINWVTIKYNTNGEMKWKRSMNWTGNGTDEPFGMNIDKDRNIYVVGFGKPGASSFYRQMITMKYSSNGDSIWTAVYKSSPTTHDWGYSVVTDDSNNVYSTGYGIIPTGNEIVTIKYNSSGNEKWIQRHPTNDGDFLRPALSSLDNSGNLIVIGNSNYSKNGDFVTLKYTANGNLLWERIYNGGNIDRANCLFIDSSSNILIAGFTFIDTYGDYLILEYSSEGDTLILENINGETSSSTDEAYSIVSDNKGDIYVTGHSNSRSNVYQYQTMKLNSGGKIIWARNYSTGNDSYAYYLALDKSGSVYVSGECFQASGNTAIVSLKYSQLTGLLQGENLDIEDFKLSNYPNPFNPSTNINYKLQSPNYVSIKIYNTKGIEINTLVNEYQNAGSHTIKFIGLNFSSGVYFYTLNLNGKPVETRRMLLIK